MRLLPHALILTLFIGSGMPADAQSGGATDTELHTAFCIGVLAAQEALPKPTVDMLEQRNRNWMTSPPFPPEEARRMAEAELPGAVDTWNKAQSHSEAKRHRLTAYLISRGVITDPNHAGVIRGIGTAMAQGRQAGAQCFAIVDRCMATNPSDQTSAQQHVETCVSTDPCPQVARCNQSDGLPF